MTVDYNWKSCKIQTSSKEVKPEDNKEDKNKNSRVMCLTVTATKKLNTAQLLRRLT